MSFSLVKSKAIWLTYFPVGLQPKEKETVVQCKIETTTRSQLRSLYAPAPAPPEPEIAVVIEPNPDLCM